MTWGEHADTLLVAMLVLGNRLGAVQPGLAYLWGYGLHKTGGLVALVLELLRLIWHRISPPPAPRGPTNDWSNRAARLVHRATYVLLVAIPLSGWVASSATGIATLFADPWIIPPLAPPSWRCWCCTSSARCAGRSRAIARWRGCCAAEFRRL